jgi:hypothetical protein
MRTKNKLFLYKGGGVIPSYVTLYLPKSKRGRVDAYNKERFEELIEEKRYLIFHLTGNYDKLKEVVGQNIFLYYRKNKDLLEGSFWYDLPEYKNSDKIYPEAYIGYENNKDKKQLLKELGIKISPTKRWVHYPAPIELNNKIYKYKIKYKINPKYPVYIMATGGKKQTINSCIEAEIPFKVIVKENEYDDYISFVNPKDILVLPKELLRKDKKSFIPYRNFAWEHSVKFGAKKHWVLDDDIDGFYRWNISSRFKIESGVLFNLVEEYVSRFDKIKQAGFQYFMFHPDRQPHNPVHFNTRIYSCMLIDNSLDKILDERWKYLKYNEDTDLSLRILKKGFATVIFNAFLCRKKASDLTKREAQKRTDVIVEEHKDVAMEDEIYNRPHHLIDYVSFKDNPLGYKNPPIKKRVNEYNMKLVKR